ncbi:MAG TPA: glycosyltransferase family 2 protein [Acidimicrobiia bacterium]|nr:glycosyltransferase family 2 protein [Acidimicrobiia bacterium]
MPRETSDGFGTAAPTVSAVVLSYRDEPWLERCVHALLQSKGVDVEVVLVDNGCTDGAVDRLAPTPGVTVLRPGENLGFAGGCNAGAARATGEFLALINGDLVVETDALSELVASAEKPGVGVAQPSIRLSDDPSRLNSDGNEVHFLGFSWCGSFGEPATKRTAPRAITSVMGAAMVIRRGLWEELGGFEPRYFAYHEDVELCRRCLLRGLELVNVPSAVVVHRYEFGRESSKLYLSERNRLLFVLTSYEVRTLLLLALPLIVVEIAALVGAAATRTAGAKLAGWAWLLRNRRWMAERRKLLQSERLVPDAHVVHLFATRLRAGNFPLPGWMKPFDSLLALYWSVARRFLTPA